MILPDIARALESVGLCLRGTFTPAAGGDVPAMADGRPTCAVVLVGNVGPAMWRCFSPNRPSGPDPLDAWTLSVLSDVAQGFTARPVFPFQRPYLPFQQWLKRAESCHASPLGLLIHPEHGLWHALRGALLFDREINLLPPAPAPAPAPVPSPCASCRERPCLTTCPVGAFNNGAYDVRRCVAHLNAPGGEDCLALGCRARRACPVGADKVYAPAQARFHMEAFRAAFSG